MADNNNPSLIGGHVQYAKGAIEETIGNVTGSQTWKDSGVHDKQEAPRTSNPMVGNGVLSCQKQKKNVAQSAF